MKHTVAEYEKKALDALISAGGICGITKAQVYATLALARATTDAILHTDLQGIQFDMRQK